MFTLTVLLSMGCNESGTIAITDKVELPVKGLKPEDENTQPEVEEEEPPTEPPEEPPVAIISSPQETNINTEVTLSGENSYDPQ